MKFEKPEVIASVLGILSSSISGLAFYSLMLEYAVFENYVNFFILVTLINGLLVAITSYFLLNTFIYQKVKIIYKNIHDLKVGSEEEEDAIARMSNFSNVEKEVADWAQERKNEIEELKERENFRREFIGNVSHELKTPIFNIQGYILTLLDGAINEPDINVKYLKRANKSVERMINLIQDMDALNKLENGIMDLDLRNFDLAAMVLDCFEILESKAKERGIKLDLIREFERPIKVFADPYKIEQVLLNLLSNAIKYGKDGGKVEVRFYDMDDKFFVEISDNGIGIPEKDIPRIFERFYRVDKSRTRDAGGSGLGLAIVKHILDVHKQTINVRSSTNVGTTFSFTLKKGK